MNNILKGITFGILLLVALSCQDKIEDEFLDPERTTKPSIGKFFTFMIDHSRVRAEYWNIRTFLVMHPGVYTQSVSFINTSRRYMQQPNYLDDYWRDYYTPTAGGIVAHMREIEKEYAGLAEGEKGNAEVFLQAARVLYYDQTAQMVDMWGDIPFSEAGSVNLTGAIMPPKFDKAEDIYMAILSGLEEAASYFAAASLDPLVASSFNRQDILLKGNLDKWRRYANSLRLRALMRISFQNESKAQTSVMEMLNSPANFPLIDDPDHDILLHPLNTYTDFMRNAVSELNSHVAPQFMLDEVLKPANDPRIRALFDKNKTSTGVYNADYYAMPSNLTSDLQEENIGKGHYAVLDSATFLFNVKFPGIVVTSSEVNLLKAEALERWGSSAEAQAAYEKGVTDAVNFAFYLNGLGGGKETRATPGEITAMLETPAAAYTGTSQEKLQKIWVQKWLSFGFMQSIQSWSEMRRTNYPALSFTADNTTLGFEMPSSRLVYPPTEKTYNAENYAAVAASDTPTGKIFWDVN